MSGASQESDCSQDLELALAYSEALLDSGDESGDGPSVFRRSALTFESRSAAFSRHESERSLGSLRGTNH